MGRSNANWNYTVKKYRERRSRVTTGKILLWGTIGLGAYIIWSKVRAIGNLIFTPGSVTGANMQGGVPFIYFYVYAQNTASTGVTVDSFAGNIFANGQLIGNVSDFQPVYIAPNSQTVVPVVAQLGLFAIVNDLLASIQAGSFKQNFEVHGYANGVGVQVPINMKFTVGN